MNININIILFFFFLRYSDFWWNGELVFGLQPGQLGRDNLRCVQIASDA